MDLAKSEAQIGCVFVVFYDTEMNKKSISGGKPWRERLTEIEPVDEEEFIAAFCSRLGIYGITDLTVSDFGAYGELVEFNLPSRGSNISDMYLCEDIFDILTDFKEKHPELVGAQFKVIDEENNITALGIVRKYNDGYSDEWTWMAQWPER